MCSRSLQGDHAARWVAWGVDHDYARAIADQVVESLQVERKILTFLQGNGYRDAAGHLDHRFVRRKTGVRVDDFLAWTHQRQGGEEKGRFCTRADDDLVRAEIDPRRRIPASAATTCRNADMPAEGV